jgi:NADH-quinone oxidoreductase subunit A
MIKNLSILIFFFIISLLLSGVIFTLSYLVAVQRPGVEKLSAYECGFDPFDDARTVFDVRFYLVAILFIIFDLEVIYLFPWCCALGHISYFGYWTMAIFLVVLTIGFVYEWCKGALEWE